MGTHWTWKHPHTHCKRGHEFTPENTYVTSQGTRRCRACARARDRARDRTEWSRAYHAQPRVMTAASEFQKRLRKRKGDFVRAYKAERGCMDCGEMDVVVLELDHRDPEDKDERMKFKNGGNNKGLGWSTIPWDVLYAELEKCDVVCANCHRRRTARQQGWASLAEGAL